MIERPATGVRLVTVREDSLTCWPKLAIDAGGQRFDFHLTPAQVRELLIDGLIWQTDMLQREAWAQRKKESQE